MQGVDLLVSEATYGSDEHLAQARDNKHMTFSEAATMARAAAAKHLWLTHFSPRIADPEEFRAMAADIFPAVEIGHSGLQGTLNFDTGYQGAL
jgi:ribonuclease Z